MVKDYEKIFATNVYEALRGKIRDKVVAYVQGDILYVSIERKELDMRYEQTL